MKFPKKVRKTTSPSFNDIAGRSWVECDVILPDGKTVDGHYEIVRGTQFYFQFSETGHSMQWFSAPIDFYDTRTSRYAITPDLRQVQKQPEFRINRKGVMVST